MLHRISILALALGLLATVAPAQLSLLSQFNVPAPTGLDAAGYDPSSGLIYVHDEFGTIRRFDSAGTLVGSFAAPTNTNDNDLDFAPVGFNLGGTSVPAGSLLFTGGESAPTIYALDASTGAVLASVATTVPGGSVVGGSYSATRGTQFLVSFTTDLIYEVDPATGATLNSFAVAPTGSPVFDIFFGDVEVSAGGNLFVVSDSQNAIRELSPTGGFVRDYNVGAIGVTGISGIAFDDARGEAYLSERRADGTVYRVGGFQPVPEPATMAALGLGMAALLRRRARRA